MSKVLVIAEHLDGTLNASATPKTAAAALALGPQIARLAGGNSRLFTPSKTLGKDLMPVFAALLGTNQISDLMPVENSHVFKRPIYAGNAIVTAQAPADQPVVDTVRTASWQEAARDGNATVESTGVDAELPTLTRFVGLVAGSTERPDLQSAKRMASRGHGIGSAENFKTIFGFVDKIGAAVGASRAAVDAGYVPNELQVGQTGKIIAPELYLATGISRSIQHQTGIKDAGTIVATNKGLDSAMLESADIGLAGDLFKVLPELEATL